MTVSEMKPGSVADNLHMTFNVMKIVPMPVKEQPYLPSSLRPTLLMTSVDTVPELSREIDARPLATAGPVHEKDPP